MNEDRKPKMESSLSERLFRAFEEAATENDAVVNEELIAYGVDPDEVVEEGLELVKNLLGKQKLYRAQDEYRRFRDAIQSVIQSTEDRTKDFRDRIARSLAGRGNERLIKVYHRKLESVELEDLASLDDEKTILELFRNLKEIE